jgi:phosphoserine phosphatase RsbU/P
MDLLYVTFPPEFGTPEWLALAALAAEQFQQASTVWAARRAGEQQAVIEEELRHATEIQMRLVPRQVEVPGLDVGIGFEPCRWVAGDYIDVVPLHDGRLFITVADVCGKGLQAALITATLHSAVHTGAPACQDLTEMMVRLNQYLCATLPDESFVTMIGLTLDPRTGAIECLNAGHPPAMVVAPGGEARQLQASQNIPLGFLADAAMEKQVDRIEPGQLLALYTDGLTEMTNEAGQMLGLDKLAEMLRELYGGAAGTAAAELSQRFKAALDGYQGNAMAQDDRTFLLIRRV